MARPIGIVGVAYDDMTLDEMATALGRPRVRPPRRRRSTCSTGSTTTSIAALAVPIADRISGFELVDGCTFVRALRTARRGPLRRDRRHVPRAPHRAAGARAPHQRRQRGEDRSARRRGARACASPSTPGTSRPGVRIRSRSCATPITCSCARRPKGDPQRHADDGGDVDFAAVLAELDRLDYPGAISIEYFDLARHGLAARRSRRPLRRARHPRPLTHALIQCTVEHVRRCQACSESASGVSSTPSRRSSAGRGPSRSPCRRPCPCS